jgi:hypothetical protein
VSDTRLSITYPAADGTSPTSVEVVWETPPDPAALSAVLAQLLNRAVPPPAPAMRTVTSLPAGRAAERCRRMLCGHPAGEHARVDDEDQDRGQGAGWCVTCHDVTKCRSFVGQGGS